MLKAISVYVSDLEAARRFYCQTLGLKAVHAEDGMIVLGNDGASFVLCEGPPRERRPYPAGAVIGLAVEKLEATIKQLRSAGVELVHETPQPFPFGRFVACVDPAGNFVELLEMR